MSASYSRKHEIKCEKIGDQLITFRMRHRFITDNKLLIIAPTDNFCRSCFSRRYRSQYAGESISAINKEILTLAEDIDRQLRHGMPARFVLVESRSGGKPFDLASYDDCTACTKQAVYKELDARNHYHQLLNQISKPMLDELRDRLFSFGFLQGVVSDNDLKSMHPSLGRIHRVVQQILGDSQHARAIYRIIKPDGRQLNDTSTGFAADKALAVLKSLMEYLERYAYLLCTCRLVTPERDNHVINEFLSLFSGPTDEDERKYIESNACWGINLCTGDVRPIPLAFLAGADHFQRVQPTSSGYAAHTSFKNALSGSILELIERDAFVRFWYAPSRVYNFKPDAVIDECINEIIAALAAVTGNNALSSNFYIVESPTRLPVVMCTISSDDYTKPPSLCFGYGVGCNLQDAVSGALKEIRINASNMVKAITIIDGYLARRFTTRIESAPDRMNFYSTSEPRMKLKFLDRTNPLEDGIFQELKGHDLDGIIQRCKEKKIDIYGIDCTPRCFEQYQISVTRAFSTKLYPLQARHEDIYNLAAEPTSARSDLPHFFI